jgi:hypothetical protein
MSFLVTVRPTPPEGVEMRQSAMQQPTSSARANELPAIIDAPTIRPIHVPRIATSHNRMFAASTSSGKRYSEGACQVKVPRSEREASPNDSAGVRRVPVMCFIVALISFLRGRVEAIALHHPNRITDGGSR